MIMWNLQFPSILFCKFVINKPYEASDSKAEHEQEH